MGFSLPSAMGIYWFIGALISLGQTLITRKLIGAKK
jgi:membrane protein insertase Oxa1/YidC/SpoIIIJ